MPEKIPVPDTDDWTWVLGQRCPQCGLDAGSLPASDVIDTAPRYVARFRHVLETAQDPAQRPEAGVWSPLEYSAHVRDVCEVFRTRIRAMLLHDGPSYEDWDQSEAAREGRYSELVPADVADELSTASGDLLRDVMALETTEFQRRGHRSDGFTFTVETLLQYFLHELVHHWWDISGDVFEFE